MELFFAQEIFDEIYLTMVQKTLRMILVLSAPMLMAAIITGIAVAMFQAVTKIQEQTLSFIPKIVATFLALVMYVPSIKVECEAYLIETFGYVAQMQVDAVLK
jgi:flagellar biosynthetic protein FliQ